VTTPPEPKPDPAPAPAAGALEGRVGKIEAEQERQGGLLDKILGKLTGDDGDTTVITGSEPPPAAGDMTEQMRQAVRDVQAEADAEVGKAHRLGRKPETSPREVMVRGKDRLQRALFGGDPK
jgi:hypothetical protein